jgi:hypothetical protein
MIKNHIPRQRAKILGMQDLGAGVARKSHALRRSRRGMRAQGQTKSETATESHPHIL